MSIDPLLQSNAAATTKTAITSDATAPVISAAAVTPSDSAVLSVIPRALYIGGAGNLVITCGQDVAAVTLTSLTAGAIIPVQAKTVWSTGTTASNIVAFY